MSRFIIESNTLPKNDLFVSGVIAEGADTVALKSSAISREFEGVPIIKPTVPAVKVLSVAVAFCTPSSLTLKRNPKQALLN